MFKDISDVVSLFPIVWVFVVIDVPVACSFSVYWYFGVFCSVCVSCVNTKLIPIVVDEFERYVSAVFLIEDVVAWF